MTNRKILVVCFGNTCRSPMLEGLLKRDIAAVGKQVAVESAGTLQKSGQRANPHSITCMRECSIDIATHRSRWVGELNLASYERIFVMSGDLRDELIDLGVAANKIEILCETNGGIPNPFNADLPADQQDMAKYIPCAAVLESEARRIALTL